MTDLVWKPHAGKQFEFCTRSEFEVLFGGSAGPGKTDCLVIEATRHVSIPGYKGLLLRRTFPQLQEIIDRCFTYYPLMGGKYKSSEHRWYFPSGAIVQLGHMQFENDKYNYQGKEYHFVGFDELTQFTKDQYLYMFSRVRSTSPDIPTRIRATTNPGGIGHYWVKERFIDGKTPERSYIDSKTGLTLAFIPATIEDNPSLYFNDPVYLARLEALPELERKRLRYGIWDAFDGQVLTELSKSLHSVEPFEVPVEWERYFVFDWGFAKPFSCGWYALDYDGVLYRYREWYGCKESEPDVGLKMPAYEVARGILERERGDPKMRMRIADPSIWHPRPQTRRRESKGPTIQEDMANEGLYFLKADNDRLQGKMQVHKRLKVAESIDDETGEIMVEDSLFKCFNNHDGFWRTLPNLQENPKNPEDVDTTAEDHIYDEFRYMCMARPIIPKAAERSNDGTFQAERNRMIKARKYAQRHGVSLSVAYNRVR